MEDQKIISKLHSAKDARAGFEALTNKYSQRVYWHVRKMVIDHDDTNDLVQDIFIKIWLNKEKFRGDSSLFTWIYRIATNETLNFLNKKKRTIIGEDLESQLIDNLESDESISGDKIHLMLQKAILTLPEKQRMVFNLKYFEELKFREISAITDTSEGALKASYHLAVKKIEEFLNTN